MKDRLFELKALFILLFLFFGFYIQNANAWQSDNGNGTYSNPILYADYPDPDIIRVTNDFYMVSTTFADSPGINVLHSTDLVNWQIISQCASNLDWSPLYNMVGGTAYRQGFWASSIRYYNGMFYVVANPVGSNGRVYYATNAAGPWQYYQLNQGIYDPGFFIDTNGTGYIVSGNTSLSLLTLSADFSQVVSVTPNILNIPGAEGSHMVRVGSYYYLFNSNPSVWPYQLICSRATNIFGPYQTNVVLNQLTGGHQGAIVDLDNSGTNYYGFVMQDAGAVGRMTYICPITWSNNWPVWGLSNAPGKVPAVAPKPVPGMPIVQPATSDDFTNSTMGLQWQWNHNPDNTKWSLTARPGYLRLMPTQATNFWVARNTLTQKGQGPWSRGEISLDVSHLQPGDTCGFGTLGTTNGQIAVNCDQYGNKYLSMNVIVPTTNSPGLSISQNSYGRVAVPGTNVYLRVAMDFNANLGTCSYSFDDINWYTLGGQFNLAFDITVGTFQGEKYAIFCYNPNPGAGYVDVDYFHFTDNIQRGRPHLNAARTTFVTDDGQPLRGPYTSTEWTSATAAANIANIRNLGFNAVHLYAEDFNTNYPNVGSQAPGYSMANVDAIVAATRTNGLYLIITIGNGAYNGDYDLAYITNFWALYGPRYANETHVIYEIQNEPVAWGPPYSSANATPPGGLTMEEDAYNIIRANAPNTPVLLFTYAVFGGTGGASSALTDIHAFNTAVFGNANAVWTNEAVAFHGYAGSQQTPLAVSSLLSAGYPCFMTEYLGTLWGSNTGILDAQLISQLEQLGVSWITFEYIPPSGVSVDVTQPQYYSNIVNWSGLSWNPDYGNFPPTRGTYDNNGLAWTTQDYANNTLSGTLHIEAENFDTGGQGIAYNVTNTSNSALYRTNEAVSIEATSDTGGGYDVTGTTAGEWLEYTIMASEPGLYNLKLRVAGSGGSVQFLAGGINGTTLTGVWTIPGTGGSQTWTTITNAVFLTPGRQVLHLNILAGGFNLNWMELSPVTSGLIANGTYKLLNRSSAFALQGIGSSGTLSAASDVGSSMQKWNLQHIGGNLYKITSVSNSWSWLANGNGNTMGFVGWWGAGGNQCFYLQPTDSGFYQLLPVQDGLSVESPQTNASVVNEAIYTGAASQQWGVEVATAPDFPTGLTITQVSATQINLTWNAVTGATSYVVERSTTSGGPYTVVATGVSATNYSDTVTAGTSYYYVVAAVVNGVQSLSSVQVGVNLPYPWQAQDVGAVGVAGASSYSNGVFTVTGAGADIQNASDAFQFAYLTTTGNCSIVARVVSVPNINVWSKAGVMIRESLNPGAANAFIGVTPGNGVTWQDRASTGGSTSWNNTTGLGAPYWVKLLRSGNTFTSYRSPDGVNWSTQGTATFTMASNTVYVGLAVTSHTTSSLCAATFDSVTTSVWPVAVPTGLAGTPVSTSQISLLWNALPNATNYTVERSVTNGGPYAVIASGLVATNYLDSGLAGGTMYYYVVNAMVSGNVTPNSAQAMAATLSPTYGSLIHRYSFLESGGTNTSDSVGGPVWSGTLPNGGTLGAGELTLSSNAQQYVLLPPGIVNGLTNFTIMGWVNLTSWNYWNRIFDFGNGTGTYMFMTPQCGGSGTYRFAITTNSNGGEQQINDSGTLSTGVWHQVAVTLNGSTGILYLDGMAVGTNTSFTLNPSSLGVTTNNYIGKSQWADPYFNGSLEDFRIYDAGLSSAEIAAAAALGSTQLLSTNSPIIMPAFVGGTLMMSWPLGSAGFTLQSSTNLTSGNWVNVTSPAPQMVGSQWQVVIPPATNSAFYRLVK